MTHELYASVPLADLPLLPGIHPFLPSFHTHALSTSSCRVVRHVLGMHQ